jgi:hypothetical protein
MTNTNISISTNGDKMTMSIDGVEVHSKSVDVFQRSGTESTFNVFTALFVQCLDEHLIKVFDEGDNE